MRIPYPCTFLATLIALDLSIIFTTLTLTLHSPAPAPLPPSLLDFLAANALPLLLPAPLTGLITWLLERPALRCPPY